MCFPPTISAHEKKNHSRNLNQKSVPYDLNRVQLLSNIIGYRNIIIRIHVYFYISTYIYNYLHWLYPKSQHFINYVFTFRNDYINASKINGGEPMGRQWIVTQGPLNTTIEVNNKLIMYFIESCSPEILWNYTHIGIHTIILIFIFRTSGVWSGKSTLRW